MGTAVLTTMTEESTVVTQEKRLAWFARIDRWPVLVAVVATCISVIACALTYHAQDTLLYSDAYSHMIIARRVIDNYTPGLAQLGSVWLPLPHLIMLPFVWNMSLWETGLGGAIPSMICYVISAIYVFLAARRITKSNLPSFLGALVFILNPNVLYVQSTPLTEPVLIATMTMTSYYFLVWAQEGQQNALIWAAACTFLATLARYDGWPLFIAILALICMIGWQKRQPIMQIWSNVLLYGLLGGFGIILWFLWNLVIFGDPLYFLTGPYSSAVQQVPLITAGLVPTYHDLGKSIYFYSVISAETLGPAIFALAVIGVFAFIIRRHMTPEVLASLAFLVPFVFYIVALFGGQAVEYAPHAIQPHATDIFYNDRYGTQIVAPAAFFIAILIAHLPRIVVPAVVGLILVQTVFTATGGIITLQDGIYGASCSPHRETTSFLAQYYDNGAILEDTFFHNPQDFPFTVGIDLKSIIYQGSGNIWNQALASPTTTVHWIYAHHGDLVSANIDVNSPAFLVQFTPVAHDTDGAFLYHLASIPLVQRTVSSSVLTQHSPCIQKLVEAQPSTIHLTLASTDKQLKRPEEA